jgi:ABC-type dipeptide/oligopeptide/nickel transport system ATPase component
MAFCYGIIGDNGSGKSTRCKSIAKLFRKKFKNGKIFAHDVNGDFGDIATDYIHAYNKNWAYELSNEWNCLVILDELRVLHPSAQTSQGLLRLMAVRRKQNINIVYVVHNPKLVLESLTYYTYKYFVYYTNSRQGSWSDKIPNSDLAITASKLINNYATTFEGNEYKKLYPKFPHIIVDNKLNKLVAVNIKKNIFNRIKQ